MKKMRKIEVTFEVIRVIAAILIAYAIALVSIISISSDPLYAIHQFILGPFSTLRRFGNIISAMIPLIFTGLGMCFMYAVNKFNLAGEGGFMLCGCMVTWIAVSFADAGLSSFVMIFILLASGLVFGALTAGIPALLDHKFDANIVVVSLMLNFILQNLTQYIMKYKMKDTGIAITASKEIPDSAKLPLLIEKTSIHAGLLVAAIAIIATTFLFYKTPLGFSIRAVGMNRRFAATVGIGAASSLIIAQMIGGALCGLGGAVEILGMYDRFRWAALTQHGFDGLMVAVLAHKNPLLVPVGAFLIAYIRTGADVVTRTTDIPTEFISVIQAIIILLIAAEMFLSGCKRKAIFRSAKENMKAREDARAGFSSGKTV